MSAPMEQQFDREDVDRVWEMCYEPSYVSEVARKLRDLYDGWSGMSFNRAVNRVALIAYILEQDGFIQPITVGADAGGQKESSPKYSVAPVEESNVSNIEDLDIDESDTPGGAEITSTWQDYKVLRAKKISDEDVRGEIMEVVDGNVTIEDKLELIKTVSEKGNKASMLAEEVLDDVMDRQFRFYDNRQSSGYNDPGVDYIVFDEGEREYGIAVEISTRWVNPIDRPYVESKKDKALERDLDLLILAPRFTKTMLDKHEDPDAPGWHDDPLGEMVHLHHLPSKEPDVYRPFATKPEDIGYDGDGTGSPVIRPDREEIQETIEQVGRVGSNYPVVGSDTLEYENALDTLLRDWNPVSERRYRHRIREAMEPLLWNFLRPYKIEQFLIDSYWDKELNQTQIGRLVDRSGSTIGKWMREWGVIRRGTGAPELSDKVIEVWKKMYRGEDPFPQQFSGYRIQAEYNSHPTWGIDKWETWYDNTTEEERQDVMSKQDSFRDNLDYTLLVGQWDRLTPSYSFILKTLKDEGVEIRPPDEAPRVPYSAYASKDSLKYMLNKDQDTIVDVGSDES